MIYVYAIGDGFAAEHAPLGLGGSSVYSVREDALTAFVSRRVGSVEPRIDALSCHDQVVASLMERGTVLPLRFGTVLASEPALREVLAARRDEFTRSLARLRGRVEFGARAVWRESRIEPPAATGREFMTGRLDRLRAARRAAKDLHAPLAELAAETTCRVAPDGNAAFAAAYLVDRSDAESLKRRAERLRRGCDGVQLVCTGPWPPYSFSEPHDD